VVAKTTPGSAKVTTRQSQTRDAELTRTAILDAAEEEFAKYGLSGARTDAIAARTGVTKAMIYYYFTSKEALYQAVLERAFSDRIKEVEQVVQECKCPADALAAYFEHFLSNAQHNPNISGIMFHEAMQNKGKYYKQIGIISMYQALASILESGIKSGVFRQLDPLHTAVNLIGLSAFYFCSHENLKHLWPGSQMLSPEMVEQHKSEAVALIMAGVLAK
jgi:TetR/AcrR family transcriptional regulator